MKHGVKALMTAARAAERRIASGEPTAADQQVEAEELIDSIMADDEEEQSDDEDDDDEEYDSSIVRGATASTFEDSCLEIKDESSIEDTKEDSLVPVATPLRQQPLPAPVAAAAFLGAQKYQSCSPSPPVSESIRRLLREEVPRKRHTSHPPTIASMLRSPSPSPEVQVLRDTIEVGEKMEQKTEYKSGPNLFVRA